MPPEFQFLTLRTVTAAQILSVLGVALGCGLFISLVYRWSYRGVSYSASFVRSMVSLAMITALVMLVIGNNLARAFGLVGAMSIIRFRTAVKDTQDIVFIFFALAAGLAAGVGLYLVALLGTASVGLVLLVGGRANYGALFRQGLVLQLAYEGAETNGNASYLPALERHCARHRLVNVRATGDRLDLTFYVRLRGRSTSAALARDLAANEDVSGVNLFYDDEQG